MAPLYPSFTTTYHHDVYPAIDPSQPALNCSNKSVLITGGGSDIGQAIAIAFGKAHAKRVALLGRTRSTLEETAASVKEVSGGRTDVFVTTADITVQSEVQGAMDSIVADFGAPPDVLVNNAGGSVGLGNLVDVDIEEFMRAHDLNVKGPLTVAQAFMQASQKYSPDVPKTLINLPSGGAIIPYAPLGASYSTSKLANAKVVEYIHHENPSWNVFNMQPGVVDTELARQAGRNAPDKPGLPAGFAVWLVAHPEARQLNGKFIWANWDIDEVVEQKDEIQRRDLLTLTLKGWAEEYNAEDLKSIARSVHRDADRNE